ncbi:MAG: PAS domain S-box protein [Proteobacteria bacterium]|nr:PAS domain S-box protein [Pseudomonadota bacterium]
MCHIVINDITEQKKAETALRESEEKYRLLYTSMEQGLALHEIISDENGKPVDYVFLDLNDSYTRILGITRDMAIGKRITEVMPKVEQYWIDVFGKVALTGESSYYENYLETTGKYYSTYSYCPKKNQFAVLVTDISERRKGEELLRKNESRHRAMMANISDVIAIIDPEGIIRYKSSNIERWFGWHPDDLVGASTWINVHPGDLDRIQNFFGFVTSKTDESGTVECRYMCKDGHYKWIEVTAVNRFHDPDIQGVLLNYHDISDRKKTEEEKLKLESQLRQAQKMESVGRLAGGVAHDFNNMLGVILGHVEMAQDQLDSAHPVFADMEEIRHAARRSADITRQLLAFARKQTVVPKQLDLNHTIQGMLNMLRRLIGENIDLTWKPGLDLWSVMVDPSQIDQILANLCVNARDGISGVGKITVETKNSTFDDDYCANHQGFIPGDYVQVSLSDNGCGMDKEILDNIFEPFFTTKGVGKGTGLGLSTVYGVIKQNNGFINVYSEPGHGSIFTFYLPRYVSKDMIKVINDFIEPSMGGHETILLVEDEPAILRMTGKMLRTQGYTVIEARTPGEAIYLAREHTGELHMLLTDVVMPEMNGRDLAHNLLMLYPNIKRLFMSGYTANVIAPHGVLDHGVHFIQKPFSKNELAAKVRDTLDYKS